MAPQTSIPVAANVLGTIGTILWCVQLVPQIWRNHRTKRTEGLPAVMMLCWSQCGVPFGVYAIVQKFNIPIQIQPQVFCLLCLITWAQCKVYGSKWRTWVVLLVTLGILAVDAALEVVLIMVIRGPYSHGVSWPVTLMGVLAFVLLMAGFLPIPFELIKRRGRVVGIDFVFLAIDWSGAFFSLLAIAVQNTFDTLFGTMYALCAAAEMSIFVSQGIWLLRTRGIRRRAKEAEKTFDEFPEAQGWQDEGINIGSSRLMIRVKAALERKKKKNVSDPESRGTTVELPDYAGKVDESLEKGVDR